MRDYGKIHTSFWTSQTIAALSDDGKILAAYLIAGPHTNMIGFFYVRIGYICTDLAWLPARVENAFAELFRNGFGTLCKPFEWCFIYKFLKWNLIENPNQGKAAEKLFNQIPDEIQEKPHLARAIKDFCKNFPVHILDKYGDILEPLRNPFETVSKPGTGAGTGTGAGKSKDTYVVSELNDEAEENCPHEKIIELYHKILPMCPTVKVWTKTRRGYLKQRWLDKKCQTLEWWEKFFTFVSESKFLTGQTENQHGKPPFIADLEWLIRPTNFAKVIEEKYHRE